VISHEVIRLVAEATYHQVWWPNHDEPVYGGDRLPVWEPRTASRPSAGARSSTGHSVRHKPVGHRQEPVINHSTPTKVDLL
jgi:hypothetical protein